MRRMAGDVWQGCDTTCSILGSEYEIHGQLLAANGGEIGSDFRISDMWLDGDTSYEAVKPDVVYNSASNQFLVVWTGDDDGGRAVAAGVYFYLVESGQKRSVGRMALVK